MLALAEQGFFRFDCREAGGFEPGAFVLAVAEGLFFRQPTGAEVISFTCFEIDGGGGFGCNTRFIHELLIARRIL